MVDKSEIKIIDILYQAKRKNNTINKQLILKAYEYANQKHKGQLRKSGEPYIIHPINVAYILANLGLDTQTICAALLHDIVEDTDTNYQEIKENFGEEIAQIVEGVTKLSRLFKSAEDKQAENYKKMFIAMEKDIRVIILKLADRLHNINTLEHLKRDRQIAISKETIELYAPIAHKLGMYDLKMQLQDGAFKYLYPKEHDEITKEMQQIMLQKKQLLEKTRKQIEKELRKRKIVALVKVETKHLYNIYKKIKEKNIEINQIKDLFAIKIILKQKQECYRILGIINNMYNIIPETFKDYIAIPRNNKYQAIHEIILGEGGIIAEVQICTYKMNKIAKYGITNYISYIKVGNYNNYNELAFQKNLSGIHDSLELKKIEQDPKEFLDTLKSELLDEEVYIFTPKGEIKVLPKHSSVIDFAYSINEKIGNFISSCKINSIDMPIITELQSGDIVEIITSERGFIPKEEWLECIKTAKAKSEIIKLLKKNKKEYRNNESIYIEAEDRENLVLDIVNVFKEHLINIETLKANVKDKIAQIQIIVDIEEGKDISYILMKVSQIQCVKNVIIKDKLIILN